MNDDLFVAAVEDKISLRVLYRFATECDEDCKRLRGKIRSEQLEVDLFNVEGGNLKNPRSKPPQQTQALKDVGLLGF